MMSPFGYSDHVCGKKPQAKKVKGGGGKRGKRGQERCSKFLSSAMLDPIRKLGTILIFEATLDKYELKRKSARTKVRAPGLG